MNLRTNFGREREMGNQKQKWTSEEEAALRGGVAKHGTGKWKYILKDPEFALSLTHRSNVDLKDKWRNMGISTAAHSSKEKIRIPRVKAITAGNGQNSASASLIDDDKDGKTAPRYNAMIFEALTAIKDSNGADISAILNFIERRHEVPQNFRRSLSSKLRRLVLQGKLEKVQNCYKIKRPAMLGTKTPTPKQKDIRSRPPQNSGFVITRETVEEAARTTARKVAEAENKSSVAAEAVREAERITKMAEENELMLQFVKEIYDQCSRGEVLLLA